jgi:hypothetical protein
MLGDYRLNEGEKKYHGSEYTSNSYHNFFDFITTF